MRRLAAYLTFALALFVPAQHAAAEWKVGGATTNASFGDFDIDEGHLSVIAPARNKQHCANGEILVSTGLNGPSISNSVGTNWYVSSPQGTINFVVRHRAINAANLNDDGLKSQLIGLSQPTLQRMTGRDHNIVSTPDGGVILQRVGLERGDTTIDENGLSLAASNEWWFNGTRYQYGPEWGHGVRTKMYTWRSDDCGKNFKRVGDIDSFGPGYRDCAYAQAKDTFSNPNLNPPWKWIQGGTDGPSLWVNDLTKNTDLALLSLVPCRGSKSTSTPDVLGGPLRKTYIYSSKDGMQWKVRGEVPFASSGWRPGLVSLPDERILVSSENNLYLGTYNASTGKYSFQSKGNVGDVLGIDDWSTPDLSISTWKQANVAKIWSVTVIGRLPGSSKVLIAVPTKLPAGLGGSNCPARADVPAAAAVQSPVASDASASPDKGKTYGYRLAVYDTNSKSTDLAGAMKELPFEVVPSAPCVERAIMHLAIVQPRKGPALVYWYDVDALTRSAVVRGRIVVSENEFSPEPFAISTNTDGTVRPFPLLTPGASVHFYGDYKTAEAFYVSGLFLERVHYFPVWNENGVTRYTEITAQKGGGVTLTKAKEAPVATVMRCFSTNCVRVSQTKVIGKARALEKATQTRHRPARRTEHGDE